MWQRRLMCLGAPGLWAGAHCKFGRLAVGDENKSHDCFDFLGKVFNCGWQSQGRGFDGFPEASW